MSSPGYETALSDLCLGYESLKPPLRVTVSEGARQNLVLRQTGAAGGPWSASETPYMVEPMDMLASRRHEALVFVGPARTGKTAALLLGWMAHTVLNDPGDMLFIQMSKDKAREFSKTDLDRALNNSPKIHAMKSGRSVDSNTFDTMFRHGVWLRTAWPTVTNVSGSTYRYVAITDIDRMENAENVDGEGPLFDLARKRTTTFLSRGMCLAESSPGIDLLDPKWEKRSIHEAPPVKGILGIYNRSDRHRLYWKCPDCAEWFEAAPGLGLFSLPTDDALLEIIRSADISALAAEYGSRIICPHCAALIPASMKSAMNARGRWIAEAQSIDCDDVVTGSPSSASIAGYWLGGVAAAYQSWRSLIERYLQGLLDYELTGSEETLKATVNTDQGAPYMSRHLLESIDGDGQSPEGRAVKDLPQYIVPDWARFIVAAVDVQGGRNARFIVQVHAIGQHQEQQLIDRYAITESSRDGYGGKAPLDPSAYVEDWDAITDKVVRATYRTSDPDREMRVKLVLVDSGGEDGVTSRAYAWWRGLKAKGLHRKVEVTKGDKKGKVNWFVRETMVGGANQSKGDVPLKLLNADLLKDAVDAGLRRKVPGPNYYHFPAPRNAKNPDGWLLPTFFDELSAEVRNASGHWEQIKKRNEAFDCCYMIRAGCIMLGADKAAFWLNPPRWAHPLATNTDVVAREERRAEREQVKAEVQVEQNQDREQQARPVRRTRGSSYLG